MKIVRSEIPGRSQNLVINHFDEYITREMRSEMVRNPGVTFQLADEAGRPVVLNQSIVTGLSKSAPSPYRIQTRASDKSKRLRLVWVSFDPGYWKRREDLGMTRKKTKGAGNE